ncbi:hypothetical protein AB0D57_20460 [Streptomyces sp. NPDC048275]|uniref:hypothetical protein n=1 Tax=Streptomyces sp. NPDC048275 TaxID=3155629 RepID=UPI0033E19562
MGVTPVARGISRSHSGPDRLTGSARSAICHVAELGSMSEERLRRLATLQR